MIPTFEQLTLVSLFLLVAIGFFCVRMLESRDIRRLAKSDREQSKRRPQTRLF
jgi:hypothetical protein